MSDNIIQLFKSKTVNTDNITNKDIKEFLDVLDRSVNTFCELSVMEKLSLYTTLVEFTKTSLGVIMKRESDNAL